MTYYAKRLVEYVENCRYIHIRHLAGISLSEIGLSSAKMLNHLHSVVLAEKLVQRPDGWIVMNNLIRREGEVFPWEEK